MEKLKKILLSCFCLTFSLSTITQVNALDEETIIAKELEIAIISGDGSAENPYIVNYEKAPYFKKYMENIEKKVAYALQGGEKETGIKPYGVLDNVLVGKAHRDQKLGGNWKYTHGAPSTSSNGNIWMKGVTYQSIADTAQTYKDMKNKNEWKRFKGIIEDAIKLPYDDALKTILSQNVTSASAKAILRALGKANSVFTVVIAVNFLHDLFIETKYKNAVNAGDGMIHAVYNTSYNGSWYSHELEEIWTSANTAYEPASYYGQGTYSTTEKNQ